MAAGMTSAIMNPVALPVGPKKLAEKREALQAAGFIIPDDIDMELFAQLTGLGSTKPQPGKEMEAIRAANFLTDNDPSGSAWITFNKPRNADGTEAAARGGRALTPS